MLRDQWWHPKALLEAGHTIRRATPGHEFFNDSAFQKVREAITAAEFATRRPKNRDWLVRLVPKSERFPDVELRSGDGLVLPFEIVEADRKTRRRGDEYQPESDEPPRWRHFDPTEEARAALDEIARVIKQKAVKNYRPRPHLVVYVNLWFVREFEPNTIYAGGLQQLYGDKLESAWVLWQEKTFRLWPNPAKIKLSASRH